MTVASSRQATLTQKVPRGRTFISRRKDCIFPALQGQKRSQRCERDHQDPSPHCYKPPLASPRERSGSIETLVEHSKSRHRMPSLDSFELPPRKNLADFQIQDQASSSGKNTVFAKVDKAPRKGEHPAQTKSSRCRVFEMRFCLPTSWSAFVTGVTRPDGKFSGLSKLDSTCNDMSHRSLLCRQFPLRRPHRMLTFGWNCAGKSWTEEEHLGKQYSLRLHTNFLSHPSCLQRTWRWMRHFTRIQQPLSLLLACSLLEWPCQIGEGQLEGNSKVNFLS